MKVFISFVLFLVAALLVGALLAYPLHLIFDLPVEKWVTKVSKLIAIITILPFLAYFHLKTKQAAGLNLPKKTFFDQYCKGLGIGIVTLAFLAMMLMILDIRVLDPEYDFSVIHISKTLLLGLLIGSIVALIEEIFFRGVMITGIRRDTSLIAAVLLSAILYAGVHFIKSKGVVLNETHIFSGFLVLQQIAGKVFLYENLDSFLALMSVGLLLALVRVKTGHIAQCIGIHTGWVMVIKSTKDMTNSNSASDLAYLVGTYDGIIGWLGFGYLCILSLGYAVFVKSSAQSS